MGGALAGMFAAREVGQFLAGSVKAFAEAEAGWNRLASTVDATGASFTALRPRIEAAADAMMEASRFGDDEFAAALQALTIQTGDVEDALGMMGLAADLAAAKQLSLESAAETLGRGLAGNTTQLTRMFPALKGSTDLFGDLQKIVAGMAEKDVQGLEGQLVQLNTAWGEFKEQIGAALTSAVDGPSIIDSLTNAIQGMTNWIGQNQGTIDKFADSIKWLAEDLGLAIDNIKSVLRVAQVANASIDKLMGRDTSYLSTGAGGTWDAPPGIAPRMKPPRIPGGAEAAAAAKTAAEAVAAVAKAMELAAGKALHAAGMSWEGRRGRPMTAAGNMQGQAFRQMESDSLQNLDLGHKFKRFNPLKGIIQDNIPEGGGPGFLGEMFGGLKSQVMGLAASFGPLAAAAAVLKPVLDGFMEAIGPALSALAEPLREVGRILGAVVAPVLEVFAEPLRLIAELFRVLMEPLRLVGYLFTASLAPGLKVASIILRGVTIAFSYVQQAIGWFVKALGEFVDKIVPDWISTVGKGLAVMGQSMIDAAKAARDGTVAVVDETEAIDAATAAAEQFADSVTNLPKVLNLALLRFKASTAGLTGTGTGSATGTGTGVNTGNLRSAIVISGPVTFNGVGDMKGVIAAVEGHVAKAEWRAGTSRLASALG